jgi:hypothetical protein
MTKKAPSPLIGQAQSISGQERGAGQSNIDTGTGMEKQAVTDPTSSPLYKALYSTEAGGMSKAYDTATSNLRAKANASGFGYSQPAETGAETELRGREASSIGQLPGQVAAESVPLELQAGRDITGAGTSELQAGNQMFTQGAVPLEQQYQQYSLGYTPLWQRMLQGGFSGFNQSGNLLDPGSWTGAGSSGGLFGALAAA